MKGRELPAYYPIFLNIRGKRCVVVGGGQVARRKVRALLESGADVEVISPELCRELDKLAGSGQIRVLRRAYQPGDLAGATIAIAASSERSVNLAVAREARKKGVLLNVVDDRDTSDFIAPAYLRRGEVTVAISTSGTSPALARKIRIRLEKVISEEYAALTRLVGEVRAEARRRGIRVDGDAWQAALDLDQLIGLLKKGDAEKARAVLLSNLKAGGEQP